MHRLLALALLNLTLLLPAHGMAQSAPENEVPPPPVAPEYASNARPPSGIGGIVVGAVGLGLGAINLATMPVCFADFYPAGAKDLCIYMSAALGATFVAIGIPSLIVGKIRRKRYREWRAQRVQVDPILRGFAVAPLRHGAQLLLRASF